MELIVSETLDNIRTHYGYTRTQIIHWLENLRTTNEQWFVRFWRECIVETFEKQFGNLIEMQRELHSDFYKPEELSDAIAYVLEEILGEASNVIKYFVCAVQMEIDAKRGKPFYTQPNIETILLFNESVIVYDIEDEE